MGASTKTSRFAVGILFLSFILIFIAFSTSYWLQNDGYLPKPKFINLGLWEICLQNFRDINRFYDTEFNGCMWVFEEEYYIIHDYLLPSFYIWTQFFFTLCFVLVLLSAIMTLGFLRVSRDNDRYILLLLSNGTSQIIAGICGMIAVITFGANGDNRDWMPNWEHNNMGWSFALAVVGTFALFPGGSLFLIEARRVRYKRLNEIGNREASSYSADDRKTRGHTDI